MVSELIAVGIALLFVVAVSASDVQEMAPSPEVIGLKGLAGEGFEDVSEIVDGFHVPNSRVPYYTYILMYDGSKPLGACGGSLIADDIVLTAAHCVHDENLKPWTRMVVFGALKGNFNTRNPFNPHTGQWRDVTMNHLASRYNPKTFHNDLAVLKLAGPIGGVLKPKLNDDDRFPRYGASMYVVGYGNIKKDGPESTYLLAADIMNQPPSVCERRLRPFYDQSIMLCADKGTCYGDSGGPLFVAHSSNAADDIQVGIMSFRFGQCLGSLDGYTRVSAYYEYIRTVVCQYTSFRSTTPICKRYRE